MRELRLAARRPVVWADAQNSAALARKSCAAEFGVLDESQLSVGDFQRELPASGGGLRTGDTSEVGVCRAGIGCAEIDVVERVESFSAKTGVDAFGDREFFAERKIPALLVVAAQAIEPQRKGAQVAGQLLRRIFIESGVGVEPAVYITCVFGQGDVFDVARENHIAKPNRRAGLTLHHIRDLPPANNSVSPARQIVGKFTAFAEGQFDNTAGSDAMRAVTAADGFIWQRIACVQKLGRVHLFRPGISQLEGQPLRKSLFDFRLQ